MGCDGDRGYCLLLDVSCYCGMDFVRLFGLGVFYLGLGFIIDVYKYWEVFVIGRCF